jgi:putative ABC transport system permease protein
MRIDESWDAIRKDLAYTVRMLRKQPGFVVTATLTLALGIGANSAIFTVVNAVLLKPLRYQDPDRLVRISGGATAVRFEHFRAAQSFTDTGAFNAFVENPTLSGADGAEGLKGASVTANFLSILGVRPLAGRSFVSQEETPGPAVAMISASLWHRRFGSDESIVGRTIRLSGGPCTIVGILPESFSFPFPDLDV